MFKACTALGVCAAVGLATASASAVVITNNPRADVAALNTDFFGGAIADLDLSGYSIANGLGFESQLSGPSSNVLETTFTSNLGSPFFEGTLRAEVFGDNGTTGPGLGQVAIVYTVTLTTGLTPVDRIEFGVDSGDEVDIDYLANQATQGLLTDASLTTPGQAAPLVETIDNSIINDLWTFDLDDPTFGSDTLSAGESFSWYVVGPADVPVGLVDATFFDGGVGSGQTLAFVTNPGQPNLDVPAPGAAAAFAVAGLAATRRRR
ncbi:MAG: hypothetical protein AAGD00_09290 [Planctomycetota bacterium]